MNKRICEIKSCINESDIVKRSVTNMIERVKTIGLKTIPPSEPIETIATMVSPSCPPVMGTDPNVLKHV